MSSLHLRGAYFALATIASAMVIKTLVENADDLLGGPRGMEVTLLRDAPWQFQSTSKEFYYVIALVFVALALVINWRILRSRYGYYLAAVRNDQDAALALGVPTTRYKLYAAMISAAMTAIGGTFYAQFVLFVSPDKVFGANLGVVIAVVCIIGGRGTLWGPVLGALLLLPSEELARSFSGGLLGADMMLYGLLLMLVIWYEPRGLVAIFQRWFKRPIKQGVTK
jgi:branched-chain amino acid transport system permease protein